jgi:hypothetical protein
VPFDLVTDVRAAARALTKRPAAALTVIVTLARGTAINAAVFAVVRSALFSGYAHVERSDRIVRIGTTRGFIYYPDIRLWQARATSFEEIDSGPARSVRAPTSSAASSESMASRPGSSASCREASAFRARRTRGWRWCRRRPDSNVGPATRTPTDIGADTSEIVAMSLYTPARSLRFGGRLPRVLRRSGQTLEWIGQHRRSRFGTAAPAELSPQANYAIDGDDPVDSATRSPLAEFVAAPTYFVTRPGDRHRRCRELVQNDRTRRTFEPIVYVPYAQHSQPNMFVFVPRGGLTLGTVARPGNRDPSSNGATTLDIASSSRRVSRASPGSDGRAESYYPRSCQGTQRRYERHADVRADCGSAMTAVLVLSALVGCAMPVIRGTRIDPATALRCD